MTAEISSLNKLLMLSVFAALLITALVPAVGRANQRPPNVLLIVSDDQGYGDLGCYGGDEVITPRLDRLAREGVRLTGFYVTWPACTPSRGSLLTGRYPQRHGVYDMIRNEAPDYGKRYRPTEYSVTFERIGGMDTREVLLPGMLKPGGYASGIYGKWDLGGLRRYLPTARGFDDFYGFVNTGIDYFTHERYGVPSMYRNDAPTEEDKGTYCTYLFQREAVRFLKENHRRPFFLYVPFNAPHGASNLDPRIRGAAQAPDKYKRMLDDDTIVIFLSDNGGGGGSDNGPLRGGKSKLFEGGVRVPCVIRYPGRVPAGTTSDGFLTSLEIVPTLLAAAAVKSPDDVILDGFDMLDVLRGERESPRREMFWRRKDDKAARVGDWKWVESSAGGGLFDLSADLGERNDLSAARPEKLKELKERFEAWEREMSRAEPRGPFRDY